jgi:integrase
MTDLLGAMAANPSNSLLALMMLCHGTRIGETCMARWSHISLAEREWFIPAEYTKTGVEHRLPLAPNGAAKQYEQNNRRGAGGSNFTGD